MTLDEIVKSEIQNGNSFLIGVLPMDLTNCMCLTECEYLSDECIEGCRNPKYNDLQIATIGKQSKENPKQGNLIVLMLDEKEAKLLEEIAKA